LYKKKGVEDKINTRTDLKEIIMEKEVEDIIDTAAVTVADAIRKLEFELGEKKQIIRKARKNTLKWQRQKLPINRAACTFVI